MAFGFTAVLIVAAACYAVALIAIRWPQHDAVVDTSLVVEEQDDSQATRSDETHPADTLCVWVSIYRLKIPASSARRAMR
jgi:hypothetical protein